jgi:predicted DNA-binding protein
MTEQMIIRIDPDLKAKVNKFAKIEGKNVSEVVRELIEDYVKSRDINSYIDDLWGRVGGKLASKGFKTGDIKRVIAESRKEH